jgi:uncharacterized protein YukE
MSGIGNVQIRVSSPDILVTQAEEVRRLGNDMKQKFQTLENTMERTKYYWIGEAGELHRKLYNEQKSDVDQMLRRLLEHPDDLIQIAQNYKTGEQANVAKAQALPSDLL